MTTIINEATVTLGEGVVTIKRKGSSALVVANILGTAVSEAITSIYLDRLVHKPFENSLGDYSVSGAVSTILHHETCNKTGVAIH